MSRSRALFHMVRADFLERGCRGGYFIGGMGGARFALPGAVERLRSGRADDRSSGRGRTLVLAAADPAQPYGAALPGTRREDQEHGRRAAGRPARAAARSEE